MEHEKFSKQLKKKNNKQLEKLIFYPRHFLLHKKLFNINVITLGINTKDMAR